MSKNSLTDQLLSFGGFLMDLLLFVGLLYLTLYIWCLVWDKMIRKEIKDQLDSLVCLLKKQYNDQIKESLFNRLFMMSLGFPEFTDVKCHKQLGI